MMYVLIEDGNTNFDLVELKDSGNTGKRTPHCIKHGAMNKVSTCYWRCCSVEGRCRAGCKEVEELEI